MPSFVDARHRFASGFLFAGLLICPLPAAFSQEPPPQAPPKSGTVVPALFSLDLKGTHLRDALISLFNNANVQYSIGLDVPDVSITLTLRDQPLENALRLLLQQASTNGSGGFAGRRLTYTKEAGVYQVKAASEATEPVTFSSIAFSSVRPSAVLERLRAAFPGSTISTDDASALLVRATQTDMQNIREMAKFMDVAPHTVSIKAEVVMVTEGERTTVKTANGKTKSIPAEQRNSLLATVIRTASGQEGTGDDKLMGTPAQSAKLTLTTTPTLLGDGTYELATRWNVSLPLPTGTPGVSGKTGAKGKSGGLVRLEKSLTNTSRLRSGETVVVGGVILSQYGLKGEILFFVTLTDTAQ